MKVLIKYIFIFTFSGFVFLSGCEKEVSVNPDDQMPDAGMIVVNSNPDRAAIYLNDKITGFFTPDTLKCLAEGNYKVTLKIENYRDTSITVALARDKKEDLYFDIYNNPAMRGGIMCRTSPAEADIYLNDSLLSSRTPFLINNLLPGKYSVKFKKYNYWDDSVQVIVKSRDNVQVNRKMADSSEWVCYKMTNSGLPTNYINYVYEDKNYNIWICTYDGGLVKYSNNKWTVYNKANSGIGNDNINRIAVDNNGIVWIGTSEAGLVKFDGSSFTKYNYYNSILTDNQINAIEVDRLGRVWIGTGAGGLIIIDGESWTKYDSSNSDLPSNRLRSIAFDELGIAWIGTYDAGIAKFDGTNWDVYSLKNSRFPSNNVDCIYTQTNQIWFGSAPYNIPEGTSSPNGGTSYFNGSVWISYKNKPDAGITDVCSTPSNDLWIGTKKFGLWKYSKPFTFKIQFTTASSLLPNMWVTDVMIDHNNYKWIATSGGGLAKYKGE